MAKGKGTQPAVNLNSSIYGEWQEGVRSVENVDQCYRHKGFLSIQDMCVIDQGVHSKHDKCNLKGRKGKVNHLLQTRKRIVQGWYAPP